MHNSIEKRRKDKINSWIYKLSELLPFKDAKKDSKVHILENMFHYVTELKDKCDRLMFVSTTALNDIHGLSPIQYPFGQLGSYLYIYLYLVREIQRLTKRCKELEEKSKNYFKLLQTAGISPNSWPQDIQFERPTKYSKKITEQQLNEFLAKNSDKINQNNKRINDSDSDSGQSPPKKVKSKRVRKKREKENKERDLKISPPTPVLPKPAEQLSPVSSSASNASSTSNQSTSSAPLIILNDQNLSTVQTVNETPQLIVNTSTSGYNHLNTFQIRPPFSQQPLQILGPTFDTNMLSRQLLLNLNPPPPPPQPQATAVLLPNGQLLPIISQPQQQPQQQPLIYATNQGIFLTNPTPQTQTTLVSGQNNNIVSTINSNTINLTQNTNESNRKPFPEDKPKELTTTIEAVAVPDKANKKICKSLKKQLFAQKVKNSKKDKRKLMIDESDDEMIGESSHVKEISIDSELKNSETKNKTEKPLNTSKDKIKSRSSSDKNWEKNEKSVKKTNNGKSKQVLTELCGKTDTKVKESCDILAEATQSIFSPPPNTNKQVSNSGKKGTSSSNKNKANKIIDNRKEFRIDDNKSKSMDNNNDNDNNKRNSCEMAANKLESNRVDASNENEVIGDQSVATIVSSGRSSSSANSGTADNKANTDIINDTNKNDNYVRQTTVEHKPKAEKAIAAGNKAEISKKSVNNTNNVCAQDMNDKTDSLNQSTPEPSTIQSNANHRTQQAFPQNVVNAPENRNSDNTSETTGLELGFGPHQNQSNNSLASNEPSNTDTQTIMTESELPSILLSLNDANEVSTESVHSVSNSSLPAFLSLSPEHLNEYLPKDNNNIEHSDESARDQSVQNNNNEMQFRLDSNQTNVEQNSNVRPQEKSYIQMQQKEQHNYSQYPKSSEHPVAPTTQTESRTSYPSNFPAIPTLINNDYSDYVINSNKSMFNSNYSTNYLDNLNPKSGPQNNNLFQFPLQNDNSLVPLYPMHSYQISNYLPNTSNTNHTNRDVNTTSVRNSFLSANETQSTSVNTAPKSTQNSSQSQTTQVTSQTSSALRQQPKPTQSTQPNSQSQPQSQTNAVIQIRSQRHPSTEQLQQQTQQRHPTQPQHTSPVSSNGNSSNKTNANSNPIQYSNHASFSSYSAEALIRQTEPPIQQMAGNDQSRYNNNSGQSVGLRIPQQNHNSNIGFSNDRNSSRNSISYSAESLIQSNQISNKHRETETEAINGSTNTDHRIPYYQNSGHNNSSSNNNVMHRPDQNNNSNNLLNFDHSINSRLMSSSSNNYTNSYPQIPSNSHLPDLRSSTVTSAAEPLFPVAPSVATVTNSNSNRNLSSNSSNSIANNSNNANNNINNPNTSQLSQNMSAPPQQASQQQQHSPVIYHSNGNQNSNSHQNKRTNNSFTPIVNPFILSNEDNYHNANHSATYPSTGQPILESNTNANSNQYPRNSRNTDFRFGNCLQPSNQNSNSSMTSHNNSNAGCFFTNTTPNTTYFPTASTTPFPPLLPSAASPFDPSFTTTHRPPMFLHDFNPPFVNSSAPNPLPAIPATNFNTNSSANNNSNNNSNAVNKSRETHSTNSSRSNSNLSRSPNQSKHSKLSQNSTSNTKTKKQNNTKQTDSTNNSSSSRHSTTSADNYLSMNDLMTTPTNQANSRYSNFSSNNQTGHNPNRQPVPSPSVTSSHSTNTKNVTSSSDTATSYSLFRPQSQNNSSNASVSANFSVNSLHNSNRTALSTSSTPSHFGSSSGHHSSHATNFHLSNIFPDINTNNAESLSLSPMKFPPPVAPMVPPPVAPGLSQSAMEPNSYPSHHSGPHHQNLYHSHHSSARISTPHNAFNSFLSSGTSATHNSNSHSFDAHITPNTRTAPTAQMSGLGANSSHPPSTFTPTHPHSHHTYPNILF